MENNQNKPVLTINENGDKEWRLNNLLHRDNDLPTIMCSNGTKKWYINGKLHRLDGPAVIHKNGTKEYWFDGQEVIKEEFDLIKKTRGTITNFLINEKESFIEIIKQKNGSPIHNKILYQILGLEKKDISSLITNPVVLNTLSDEMLRFREEKKLSYKEEGLLHLSEREFHKYFDGVPEFKLKNYRVFNHVDYPKIDRLAVFKELNNGKYEIFQVNKKDFLRLMPSLKKQDCTGKDVIGDFETMTAYYKDIKRKEDSFLKDYDKFDSAVKEADAIKNLKKFMEKGNQESQKIHEKNKNDFANDDDDMNR